MAARRHTEAELRSLSHDALVHLVLELQDRVHPKAAPPSPPRSDVAKGSASTLPSRGGITADEDGEWTLLDNETEASPPEEPGTLEVQEPQPKRLERAISKVPANVAAAAKLRQELAKALFSGVPATDDHDMLRCSCGYTCGTPQAMQKHCAKYDGVLSAEHRQQLPRDRAVVTTASTVAHSSTLPRRLTEKAVAGGVVGGTTLAAAATIGQAAFQRLTHANFFLPELADEGEDFRRYIYDKLTSATFQKSLETDGVLNWAIGKDLGVEHKLHALWALSDGNCLLHASLLAIWGLHDTHEVGDSGLGCLRAAMSRVFTDDKLSNKLRRRWGLQIAQDNAWQPSTAGGPEGSALPRPGRLVEVSDSQMDREWKEMTDIAGRPKMFLDSVHILALAHTLKRPFIVLANSMQNDPFGTPLTPLFFKGLYLPLEFPPEECCRQPLVLCFQDSHFMPLVPLARSGDPPVRIPLADRSGEEFPLRFATKEELFRKWDVVQQYLDVERDVRFPSSRVLCNIAVLRRGCSHRLVDDMIVEFVQRGRTTFQDEHMEEEAKLKQDKAAQEEARRKRQEQEDERLAMELSIQQAFDEDAQVVARFDVRLPIGARPGDRNVYALPKGCTIPEQVEFIVPEGAYGRSTISLSASFKIKGSCIKSLRDATGLGRERAIELLTDSLGDPNQAAQRYFY